MNGTKLSTNKLKGIDKRNIYANEMNSFDMKACVQNLGSDECKSELEKIVNESLKNVLSKKEEYMLSRHPELCEGYDGDYLEEPVMNDSQMSGTISKGSNIIGYLKQLEKYNERNMETLENDINELINGFERTLKGPFAKITELKELFKSIKKIIKQQLETIEDTNEYYYESIMKELK